jgi:hypothetical protein
LRTVHYLKLQDYRAAYLTPTGRSAVLRRSAAASATVSVSRKKKSRTGRRGRPRTAVASASPSSRPTRKSVDAPSHLGDPQSATVDVKESAAVSKEQGSSSGQPIDAQDHKIEARGDLVKREKEPTPPPKMFVDNFEESCLSLCRLCGLVYPVDSIRSHLKIAHLVNIRQYREQHGPLEYVRETYLR